MAEASSLRESKLSLLAICVAVVLALGGYAVGKIEQNSTLEQKVKTIDENYISKDKYNSDIGNLKESLSEIKSDLKDIKRGLK